MEYRRKALFIGFYGISNVLTFLNQLVVARSLPTSEFANYQSLSSLFYIFSVTSIGLSLMVLDEVALHVDRADTNATGSYIRELVKLVRRICAIAVIPVALIAWLVAHELHLPTLGIVAVTMALVCLTFSTIYSNALHGWRLFAFSGALFSITSAIRLLSCFVLIHFTLRAQEVYLGVVLGEFACLVISYLFFCRRFPVVAGALLAPVNFSRFVKPILFSGGIACVANLDVLALKRFTTAEITGQFAAIAIFARAIYWAAYAVILTVLPSLFSAKGTSRSETLTTAGAFFFIAGVGLVVSIAFPAQFIEFVLGAQYLSLSPYLFWVAIYGTLLSANVLGGYQVFSRAPNVAVIMTAVLSIAIVFVTYAGSHEIGDILRRYVAIHAVTLAVFFALSWLGILKERKNEAYG